MTQIHCRNCGKIVSDAKRSLPLGDGFITVCIPFCNFECEEQYNAKKAKEEEDKRILNTTEQVLPEQFQSLITDQKHLLEKCYNKSLYIYGTCGIGKSVFMANELIEYIKKGKRVLWESYPGLITNLKGMFANDSKESPYKYAEKIANFTGVVALDDMGVEKKTDFVNEITYFIINQRESNSLITLITSNWHYKQFEPRIASRIAGMSKILHFYGTDRRKLRK